MSIPKIISVSVDVTMLEKARFIAGKKPNKAGKIPQYANLTLMCRKDGPDQFGNDYFITQTCSKEERQAKKEMPILGNAKIVLAGDAAGGARRPAGPAPASGNPIDGDDVPF